MVIGMHRFLSLALFLFFVAISTYAQAQDALSNDIAEKTGEQELNSTAITEETTSPVIEGNTEEDVTIFPSFAPNFPDEETDDTSANSDIDETAETDSTPQMETEPEESIYQKQLEEYLTTIHEEDFTSNALLQALNKITAQVHTLKVSVGKAVKFGNLSITLNRCWLAPKTQIPESKALLFIEEQIPGEEKRAVFEGWMFASSPSLSALEHPVYDVRLLECVADTNSATNVEPEATSR